jgi:hypothetical protein
MDMKGAGSKFPAPQIDNNAVGYTGGNMSGVDYLGYAQAMGQRNPIASGLNQIGQTLDQKRAEDMQMQQMLLQQQDRRRRNSLADLQMRQGEMQMQGAQAQLQDQQAQQGARQSLYGVNNPQDAYLAEMKATQEAAKRKQRAEMSAKHLDSIKTYKSLGMRPEFLTEFTKAEMMKDPELAPMAQYVSFADDTKMEITKPFKDGELRNPMNPQEFLPAGTYKVIGTATGNPEQPYQFNKIEPVEAPMPKHIPEGAAVPDGKGGFTIPAPRREKPIVINTGGGRSGGRAGGKAPSGYRYTDDGNLEAIPGGPAALKVDAALQSKEKAKGAYDSSIAVVDKLLAHPGRASGTGLSSKLDPRNYTPGTDAYDFQRELESFDSVLFLSNIEKMKGMGALSNAEGAKVSAAAGAIKPGMKDTTFVNNLRIIRAELNKAKTRIDNGNLMQPQGRPSPGKGKDPLGIL